MDEGQQRINVAVVGCGQWGFNHVRVFSSLPESRVVAIADPDAERLRRVAEVFPGVRCVPDASAALDDATVDAVVVATPVSAHDAVVAQALECGKHVLCEKPLCADVAAARRLVALAERCGRVLMVGNVFLFNAGILKLKELLDNGEIGELHYLTAVRTNLGPIRSDVNAAFDLATHDIAIFNWLLGSLPIEVTATGAAFVQPGIEDVVFITLRYPGGILANIHASWLSPRKVRQITLVGSRRMATWDDLELVTPVAVFDKGATAQQEYGDYGQFLRLSMWDGDVRLPKIVADEPLKVQNRAFLAAVRSGRAERSDGAFSLGVVQTLDAVRRSLAQHGCAMAVAA